eukprot:s3763_g12.t1
MAPEDEIAGVDIDVEQHDVEAGQPSQGRLVYAPERGERLNFDVTELYATTALATLREACGFYNLSQAGSKERCFKRLWEHQKRLELQTALAAARETEAEQRGQPAAASGEDVQEVSQLIALILVDSETTFTRCVPISKKNDFDVMVREILQFSQVLGHGECNFLCDNESSILQVQKRAVQARKAMGLVTHSKTPSAYDRGNSLCENTLHRVRGLAGTLMHNVPEKLSIKLSADHGLWSWALRHSS